MFTKVKLRDPLKPKSEVARVDFYATIRGRTIKFNWKTINQFMGITNPDLNKSKYHRRFVQEDLEEVYGTSRKRVSSMPDAKRVLQYIY